MEPLRIGAYVLCGTAAVVATLLARRDRHHRVFAGWMVWGVASDWTRVGITALKEGAPRPYTGMVFVAAMADRALVLLWTFGFLLVVWHYFTPLRTWKILAILALPFGGALAYAWNYPAVRGDAYADLIRVVAIFGVAATWIAIIWGTLFREDGRPTVAHLCIMFLACADVIVLAIPYAGSLFTDWDVTRLINVIALSACVLAHAWALARRPADAS